MVMRGSRGGGGGPATERQARNYHDIEGSEGTKTVTFVFAITSIKCMLGRHLCVVKNQRRYRCASEKRFKVIGMSTFIRHHHHHHYHNEETDHSKS